MKKNKKRFIALILCLILSFNIVSAFEVPEAEAIAGVDDVAFIGIVSALMTSCGYVASNRSDLDSISSSAYSYLNDTQSNNSALQSELSNLSNYSAGDVIFKSQVGIIENCLMPFIKMVCSLKKNFDQPSDMYNDKGMIKGTSYLWANYSQYMSNIDKDAFKKDAFNDKYYDFIEVKPKQVDSNGRAYFYVYFYECGSANPHKTIDSNTTFSGAYVKFLQSDSSIPNSYKIQAISMGSVFHYCGYFSDVKYNPSSSYIWSNSCSAPDSMSGNEMSKYLDSSKTLRLYGDGKARKLSNSITLKSKTLSDTFSAGVNADSSVDQKNEYATNIINSTYNTYTNSTDSELLRNSALEQILDKLTSLEVAFSKPATEGSSALQLDQEQWKVVEGSGGNPKNDDDNNNKRPKWATLAFLAPLVMVAEDLLDSSGVSNDILEGIKSGVNTGFENIGNAIDSIKGFVSSILEAIKALPEAIFNAFKDFLNEWKAGIEFYYQSVVDIIQAMKVGIETLVNYVFDILTQLQALPQALADIIADQFAKIEINPLIQPIVQPELNPNIEVNPAIEVNPNIELSPLLNPLAEIVRLLEEILEAIKEFFSINPEAISDNWNSKTPNFSIQKYAKPFIFAHEFGNEPPILVVDTPDVVRGFYEHDQIVIFDARNYDKYFKIIRMIVNAIIIIAYAYACLCKFKVRFSM